MKNIKTVKSFKCECGAYSLTQNSKTHNFKPYTVKASYSVL